MINWGKKKDEYSIWMFSDNHEGSSVGEIETAISQIDQEPWDIAINLGDIVQPDGANDTLYGNYIANFSSMLNHGLEDVYHVIGNHDTTDESDASGADFYFKKYCSPIPGDNAYYSGQPIVPTGDYLAYKLEIGNLVILCLGDHNSGPPPGGEDGLGTGADNFRASGEITSSQWTWLKDSVEANKEKILIVCSHIGIKDTVVGTGFGEFWDALNQESGIDIGTRDYDDIVRRGYIAYINNSETNFDPVTGDSDQTNEIKTWLEVNGRYIDVWCSGHYHRKIGEIWKGRTRHEVKYNTHFLNVSVLQSKLHLAFANDLEVKSNMFTLKGDRLLVKTYVHYDPNSLIPTGYYAPEEIEIKLKRNFYR